MSSSSHPSEEKYEYCLSMAEALLLFPKPALTVRGKIKFEGKRNIFGVVPYFKCSIPLPVLNNAFVHKARTFPLPRRELRHFNLQLVLGMWLCCCTPEEWMKWASGFREISWLLSQRCLLCLPCAEWSWLTHTQPYIISFKLSSFSFNMFIVMPCFQGHGLPLADWTGLPVSQSPCRNAPGLASCVSRGFVYTGKDQLLYDLMVMFPGHLFSLCQSAPAWKRTGYHLYENLGRSSSQLFP